MSDDKKLTIQADDNEQAVATTANKPAHDKQQPVSRHDGDVETKKPRRRKGVKQTTNTCSTSPRAIRIAERRAQALDLRVEGHSFRLIGQRLGISTAQAAIDVEKSLAAITLEPAKELLKLELQRLDQLTAAHFLKACQGDVASSHIILRTMVHRATLLGWSRDQQGAARVVISDGGDESRRLELEFILPSSQRISDLERLERDHHIQQPPEICSTVLQTHDRRECESANVRAGHSAQERARKLDGLGQNLRVMSDARSA